VPCAVFVHDDTQVTYVTSRITQKKMEERSWRAQEINVADDSC